MTAAQFCGFALSAMTAAQRIVAIVTPRSGALRIMAKNAYLTGALVHLGFRRLSVWNYIHIIRGLSQLGNVQIWVYELESKEVIGSG